MKEKKKCYCGNYVKQNKSQYCSQKCVKYKQWQAKKLEIEQGLISHPVRLKRYIKERDGHACAICKLTEWMGQPIPLILDHIDGHHENNLPYNLRLVCGNCDMQLPTYKSKNKGKGRAFRRQRYAEGKSY